MFSFLKTKKPTIIYTDSYSKQQIIDAYNKIIYIYALIIKNSFEYNIEDLKEIMRNNIQKLKTLSKIYNSKIYIPFSELYLIESLNEIGYKTIDIFELNDNEFYPNLHKYYSNNKVFNTDDIYNFLNDDYYESYKDDINNCFSGDNEPKLVLFYNHNNNKHLGDYFNKLIDFLHSTVYECKYLDEKEYDYKTKFKYYLIKACLLKDNKNEYRSILGFKTNDNKQYIIDNSKDDIFVEFEWFSSIRSQYTDENYEIKDEKGNTYTYNFAKGDKILILNNNYLQVREAERARREAEKRAKIKEILNKTKSYIKKKEAEEERARKEAKRARKEAEEKARREAEEEERARREAERARKEAEERARKEAEEERARREAEAEKRARREAEEISNKFESVRREAEDVAEKARNIAAELRSKREIEELKKKEAQEAKLRSKREIEEINTQCTNLDVIPDFSSTCWFNAILMASLYSQGSRNILLNEINDNKWGNKDSLQKVLKSILIQSYKPDKTKIRDLYKKIKPEKILLKMISKYDNDFKEILKIQLQKKNHFYWINDYIVKYLKHIGMKCLDIYYHQVNKEYFVNYHNYSVKYYDDKSDIIITNKNENFNNELNKQELEDLLKDGGPDYLILFHSGLYDKFNYYYYNDWQYKTQNKEDFKIDGFINKSNLEQIENYKDIIDFNGNKYKLDSCLLFNYNVDEINNGHSIVGLTCNNKRYVYNGWNMNYTSISPCSLFAYEWDLKKDKNKDFCLNQKECKLDDINKEDLCFSFNKGRRILIYTKIIDEKDIDLNISESSKSNSLSRMSSIIRDVYDLKDYLNDDIINYLIKRHGYKQKDLEDKDLDELKLKLEDELKRHYK